MQKTITVSYLDHLVLTVKDINKTIEFYQSILGMKERLFNNGRIALTFGGQAIICINMVLKLNPMPLVRS